MIKYDQLIPHYYYEVLYGKSNEIVYLVQATTQIRVQILFRNGVPGSADGGLKLSNSIRLVTEEYALSGGKLSELPMTNKSAVLFLDKEYK